MSVTGHETIEAGNVVSLFGARIERSQDLGSDPLQDLLNEAEAEAFAEAEEAVVVRADRVLVSESQFPDQSMYLLEKQLAQLNQTMGRLKFYLSDLDDLLPR